MYHFDRWLYSIYIAGQFQSLPDLTRILQIIYGQKARALVNNEAQISGNSATTTTHQSLMAPVNTYNRLLGAISTKWDGMEQQLENRLDTVPDNAVGAAEQRVALATDYFENTKEQKPNKFTNGWDNVMSNHWGVTEDNIDQKMEQLDTNMDDRVELVENVYGDQVADTVETIWDTTKDVIDNAIDTTSDALDTVKDVFDSATDDWYLSFDSIDDGWDNSNDNHDWFNGLSTNDQDNDWDSYSYSF